MLSGERGIEQTIMEITKEQFDAYRRVQFSGVTNMWNRNLVCDLSGLSSGVVGEIMQKYAELEERFGKFVEN